MCGAHEEGVCGERVKEPRGARLLGAQDQQEVEAGVQRRERGCVGGGLHEARAAPPQVVLVRERSWPQELKCECLQHTTVAHNWNSV